jgi:hypothetical protein
MTTEKQTAVVTEVIDGRMDVYGDPVDGMKRTAQIWSGILDFEVRPDQVALMLMGYKLMRASVCPDYSDNIDDTEGYGDIFKKVVGDDMVHARSVSEYLEIKARRAEHAVEGTTPGDDDDDVREPGRLYATYFHHEHTTDCIAAMSVKTGPLVQCTCVSRLTAGTWFMVVEAGL